MSNKPDYNTDHPSTLYEAGVLGGEAVGIDLQTIRPLRGAQSIFAAAKNGQRERELVVIKVIPADKSREPRNGRREARLLAKLSHPNIVSLLNSYLDPPSTTSLIGRITLFLPHYPLTLRQLLDSPRFVSGAGDQPDFDDYTASIAWQLVSATSYLHERSISHRDINPSNIVISEEGRPLLIDFGIAVEPGDEKEGEQHFEVGTGPYRAPELVFSSRKYDPRALDLWALATTLAEMFRPFASPPLLSPSSDDDIENPFATYYALPQSESTPTRQTLFTSGLSDFVLAASIFKVVGTPTLDTWPEAKQLPNFARFGFASFPPTPLKSLLPHLDTSSPLLEMLESMLVCSASKRMTAATALDRIQGLSKERDYRGYLTQLRLPTE